VAETRTEIFIRIEKEVAVFEDCIIQGKDESDEYFLKRASVILEFLRHKSK